jgi:integrase
VGRAWAKLSRRAELPGMRFHDLRHNCATFDHENGVQPRMVMAILGHADIRTTMRYSDVQRVRGQPRSVDNEPEFKSLPLRSAPP